MNWINTRRWKSPRISLFQQQLETKRLERDAVADEMLGHGFDLDDPPVSIHSFADGGVVCQARITKGTRGQRTEKRGERKKIDENGDEPNATANYAT